MALLKVGPLPKVNSGGHNRPGGVFAGHAEDAAELKRLARRKEANSWGCVRADVKSPTASRTAMVIRKGLAVDFQPDDEGYFIAKARQGEDYVKGSNEVFEVWVKYKFWESEDEKRHVLASMEKAKSKTRSATTGGGRKAAPAKRSRKSAAKKALSVVGA